MDEELTMESSAVVSLEDVLADLQREVTLRPLLLDRIVIRYASPGEVLYRVYHRDLDEYDSGYLAAQSGRISG